MNLNALLLTALIAFPLCAQAKNPKGVKPLYAEEITTLNAGFAEPSDDYDTPARVLKAYVPIYPISRYMAGKTGVCRVAITISRDGRAKDMQPDTGADSKMCAHALYALQFWEFEPASKQGEYVQTKFRMPFNYDIE